MAEPKNRGHALEIRNEVRPRHLALNCPDEGPGRGSGLRA